MRQAIEKWEGRKGEEKGWFRHKSSFLYFK